MLKLWQIGTVILLLTITSYLVVKFKYSTYVIQNSTLGEDHTPPGPAQYDFYPEKETSNSSTKLLGHAQANSKLIIINNSNTYEQIVTENTIFNFTLPLEFGDNNISLKVIDRAGNINDEAPKISIKRF